MQSMFEGASKMNSDLSRWNVRKVTDMSQMFFYAESFNGNVSAWNVSNVKQMTNMFRGAESFNGDLSKWKVSDETDMSCMFDANFEVSKRPTPQPIGGCVCCRRRRPNTIFKE